MSPLRFPGKFPFPALAFIMVLLLANSESTQAAQTLPEAPLPPSPRRISNIISPAHCPDPDVIFHEGYYYAARSRIEASSDNLDPPGWYCWHAAQDQVIITRARRLEDVYTNPDATSVIINRKSPMGGTSGGVSVGAFQISYKQGDGCPSPGFWAPALKHIDGHWFLFITGHRPDVYGEANFLLENLGDDPMDVSSWEYRGMLGHALPGLDGEPIVLPTEDPNTATVTLRDNGKTITGQLYFVYSHNIVRDQGTQVLNLVRLVQDDSSFTEYDADLGRNVTYKRKWTAAGEAPISAPAFELEQQRCTGCRFSVNEGPTALYGPNSTFIMFSASFCATKYYSLGLLEYVRVGSGFPFEWIKHPRPVFSGDIIDDNGALLGVRSDAFGIGHNSITTSADLSESWIVYHAKTTQDEGPGDREARAQKFKWSADGRPDFSPSGPKGQGSLIHAPSEASVYAVFCSESEFRGRFCVGVVPGRYTPAQLAVQGVVLEAVRSLRLVGDAAVNFYKAEDGDTPAWSVKSDLGAVDAAELEGVVAVEVLEESPSAPSVQLEMGLQQEEEVVASF